MFLQTKPLVGVAVFALFTAATPASAATLLQYQFSDNGGITTTETPSFVATNLTGNALTRGSGLTAESATDGFNSASWGAYATNPNDFLAFGFGIADGYTASVTQLTFGTRSSGTGPRDLAVLASVDGGLFTQVGAFSQGSSTGDISRTINIATPLTAVDSIAFRIVANSALTVNGGTLNNGGGTFRVQNSGSVSSSLNPFTITGDVALIPVALVPEPATWAMMIGGIGLAGGALRRRQRVAVRFA